MSAPELTDEVTVALTVEEIVTTQAALNVAKEQNAVTPAVADSVTAKLDDALDRWDA